METIKIRNNTSVQYILSELGKNFTSAFEPIMEIIDNATAIPFDQKAKIDIYIKETIPEEKLTIEFHDYIGGIPADKLSDVITIKKNKNGQKGVNEHGFGLKNAISFFDPEFRNSTLYTRTPELKAKSQYIKYDLTFAKESDAEIRSGTVFDNSEASTIIQVRDIKLSLFSEIKETLTFLNVVKWCAQQFRQRYHNIDVNLFYIQDGEEIKQMPVLTFDPDTFFDKNNYYTDSNEYCNIILSRRFQCHEKGVITHNNSYFDKRHPIVISNGRRFIAKMTLKDVKVTAAKPTISTTWSSKENKEYLKKISNLLGREDVFIFVILKNHFPETTTFKQQFSVKGKNDFITNLEICGGLSFIRSHLSANEKNYADYLVKNPPKLEASEKQIAVAQDITVQDIFGNVQAEYPVFKNNFKENKTCCPRIDAFVQYKNKNIAFEWKNPQISASTKFLAEINHYARGFFFDNNSKIDYFILVTNGEESKEMKEHFFNSYDSTFINRIFLIKKSDLIKTCEEIKNEIDL